MCSCLFRFGARGGTQGPLHTQQRLSCYTMAPSAKVLPLNAVVLPAIALAWPPSSNVCAITHHSGHIVSTAPGLFLASLSRGQGPQLLTPALAPAPNSTVLGILEHPSRVQAVRHACSGMRKESYLFSIMNKVLFPHWASVSLPVK